MNQFYNSFYIEGESANSQQENQCFQAWEIDKSLSDGCDVQIFKNIEINPQGTQSTYYSNMYSLQSDQCTQHNKERTMKNQVTFREQGEKLSKLKNQRVYNQIETSVYCLEKTVKSYKGKSQETVNLNKYYGKCLRDYIQTLAVCQIISEAEIGIYLEKLKNNEINGLKFSGQISENCAKYVKSSHIISQLLLSNKMDFNNKITAIKYMSGFAEKLGTGRDLSKIWKNDRNDKV